MTRPFTTLVFSFLFFQLYAQPGTPDSTFGKRGKAVNKTFQSSCYASLLQPDGKIITGGGESSYTRNGSLVTGALVVRYNDDGNIDFSFGDSGKAIYDFGDKSATKTIYSLALQKDGKILAAVRGFYDSSFNSLLVIMRLNTDGSLDTGFGVKGRAIMQNPYDDDNYEAADMAMLPDGRMVITGNYTYNVNQGYIPFVTCFTVGGFVDSSFGNKGTTTIYEPDYPKLISCVAAAKDGNIVIGGEYEAGKYKTILYRINGNGVIDSTFGDNGLAEMPFEKGITTPSLSHIAIADDNTIAAVGYAAPNNAGYISFMASRFLENGKPDISFGNKGYTITNYANDFAQFNSVAVQRNGKMIACGSSLRKGFGAFTTISYNADGTLDSSFGKDGISRTNFVSSGLLNSSAYSVLQQCSGKIVVCGYGTTFNYRPFIALVRYYADEEKKQLMIARMHFHDVLKQ